MFTGSWSTVVASGEAAAAQMRDADGAAAEERVTYHRSLPNPVQIHLR